MFTAACLKDVSLFYTTVPYKVLHFCVISSCISYETIRLTELGTTPFFLFIIQVGHSSFFFSHHILQKVQLLIYTHVKRFVNMSVNLWNLSMLWGMYPFWRMYTCHAVPNHGGNVFWMPFHKHIFQQSHSIPRHKAFQLPSFFFTACLFASAVCVPWPCMLHI